MQMSCQFCSDGPSGGRFRGGQVRKIPSIYLSSPGSTIPSAARESKDLRKGENLRHLRISPPYEGGAGGGWRKLSAPKPPTRRVPITLRGLAVSVLDADG